MSIALLTIMLVDAGGRRGQRRTGSQTDDVDYGSTRPSAPATLFDFVTSKMSQSSSAGRYFAIFTVRRYALHGLSHRNSVRPSVRPSVCPSVCHTRALCPHGSTYDHDFFTIW